jgi:acyl carrier protein
MDRTEIESTMRGIIVTALRVKPERVTPAARLFLDLGAESIDIIDIRFNIESAFRLKVSDYEIEHSLGEGLPAKEIAEKLTFSRVCDFVQQRLSEAERK